MLCTAELHSESEMKVEEASESPFTTKLATAISKALCSTCDCQSDLAKLDCLKIKHGKVSAKYMNNHKKLMSIFRVKLNQKRQHLKAVITRYERKLYLSQNRLADKDTDKEYSPLLRQHYHTSKLVVSPDFNVNIVT